MRGAALLGLALAAPALAQDAAQKAVPAVPDGFAVDLVAESPAILWPSAVHCLADGTLLVSEDRMDMPGPTDQPLDKLFALVWKPDGTFEKKLFAERLYAIMGLQQIDGAVYVMNMPHLTVLRDTDGDRVADERTELLTDLGPPAPGWPGGFNDHIVTGLRLGMDGWLYVAVGDKGVPAAHGTDGSTITLRGGGIVRVRPDGSRLEVVTRGTRNHLDVAVDEAGEMFTYDNTDDGLGWWTRVTHHVPGGYYGYPWDYHDHTDRMLPPMADFGGGSPCGAIFYRGGVWPEPYAGSAYWCEWGKGMVQRFAFARKGASFDIAEREDFMTPGSVANFRPLDIAESPDERFLYVADWAYTGWTAPDEAGRLWRIRRADDTAPPGAIAPLPSDAAALARVLEEPSFQRRLAAQRSLARARESKVLADLLAASPSERARRHAIWALAAIGDAPARAALHRALAHADADTRAQAARAAGELGREEYAFSVLPLLADPDPFVRRWAAWALGRIGEPAAAEALVAALLASDDPFLQATLRGALQRTAGWRPAVAALATADEAKRKSLWLVFRDQYDAELVALLARAPLPQAARAEALAALGDLHREPQPWDGKWWSIAPARTHTPSPHTIDWAGTAVCEAAIVQELGGPDGPLWDAALRAAQRMPCDAISTTLLACLDRAAAGRTASEARVLALLDAFTVLKDIRSVPRIAALVRDRSASPAVRSRAVDSLSAIADTESARALAELAARDDVAAADLARCIEALGRAKQADSAGVIERRLAFRDASVREAAASAYARVRGKEAAPALARLLADPDPAVRRAAARALGFLDARESVAALVALTADADVRDEAVRALCRMPDARALDAYLAGAAGDPATRDACNQALQAIAPEVRAELERRAAAGTLTGEALAAVQKAFTRPEPIVAWHVVGPFPKLDADPALESAAPDFARTWRIGEQQLAWRAIEAESKNGFVDLNQQIAKQGDAWAYAACTLTSARVREAELWIGSDDQLAVWLDGEKVHEHPDERGLTLDADRFTVRLAPGTHQLLLRVGQNGGEWSFNAKVSPEGTGPLFETAEPARPTVADFRDFAAAHAGDVARGAALFRAKDRTLCLRCHAVAGDGEHVGPDLSDVGAKYARDELVASVLEPSRRIAEAYQAIQVVLADEHVLFGQVRGEKNGVLELVDQSGVVQEVDQADVVERKPTKISVMPDGLATQMSREEFADLIAYLESLRGPPAK